MCPSPDSSPATGVSNAKVAAALLITAEILFFAGLVSAFLILRGGAGEAWPPPGQPRLPWGVTAFYTAVLLASAGLLVAWFRDGGPVAPEIPRRLFPVLALGGVFLAGQGFEWVRLILQGLTLRSGLYGALFYLIVGTHALHVLGGWLWVLLGGIWAARGGSREALEAGRAFWVFVALLWPGLYVLVYF